MLVFIILMLCFFMMLSSTIVVFTACILAKRQSNPQPDLSIGYINSPKQTSYEHAVVHSPQETVYSFSKAQ